MNLCAVIMNNVILSQMFIFMRLSVTHNLGQYIQGQGHWLRCGNAHILSEAYLIPDS